MSGTAHPSPLPETHQYFICGKEYGPKLDQGCARQEMAPNITFLGSHGAAQENHKTIPLMDFITRNLACVLCPHDFGADR
jgi:hypothetical protein